MTDARTHTTACAVCVGGYGTGAGYNGAGGAYGSSYPGSSSVSGYTSYAAGAGAGAAYGSNSSSYSNGYRYSAYGSSSY